MAISFSITRKWVRLHRFVQDKHVVRCASELKLKLWLSFLQLVCCYSEWGLMLSHSTNFFVLSWVFFLDVQRLQCRTTEICFSWQNWDFIFWDCCNTWVRGASVQWITHCKVTDRKGNPVRTTGQYFRVRLGHCVVLKVLPRKPRKSGSLHHCDFNLFVLGYVCSVVVVPLCLKSPPLSTK